MGFRKIDVQLVRTSQTGSDSKTRRVCVIKWSRLTSEHHVASSTATYVCSCCTTVNQFEDTG